MKLTSYLGITLTLTITACGSSSKTKRGPDHAVDNGDVLENPVVEEHSGILDPENDPSKIDIIEGSKADEASEVRGALVDFGFRDFSQIFFSMAAVTGVDPANQTVRAEYNRQLMSMPAPGNDIKAFVAAHQSAIFKLGVEFCDAMMNDVNLTSQTLPNFDFAAGVGALNATSMVEIATALISRFWGEGLSTLPDHDTSVATVVALMNEILADTANLHKINEAQRSRSVVKGACVSILTSLPMSFL